ncbi:MAG TPA: hypothetical protein PKL75_11025, partial [Treponemataceae bacterium]|nr:hypothetical protein [Treponemataceae bacterium]
TDALNDMRRIAGDREFKSAEDLQAFLESYMAITNSQPIEDFAGLSPEDVHIMFSDRQRAIDRLVSISGPIPTEETRGVPVLRAAIALLRELERGPIRMTASGYLAPDAAGRWFDEAFELEESPRVREIMKPKSESGFIPLVRFRSCLCLAGFAEARSSRLCITDEGRAILGREDWQSLYRDLFAAMIEIYADTENPVNDRMMDGAGEWTLFALRLIALYDRDAFVIDDLCAAYRRAFPQYFDGLSDDDLSYFVFADAILPARELGILREETLPVCMEGYSDTAHETVTRTAFGKKYVGWRK